MMKRLLPVLAVFTLLASPAGALKMVIWDRVMQTPLGSGESTGSKFSVRLVKEYSGPVVVIFAQTEEEKRNATYPGLQNRYDGILKNGELTLAQEAADSDRADKADSKAAPVTTISSGLPVPAGQVGAAPRAVGLTLKKLLQQFKLTVTVQTTSQTPPAPDDLPPSPGAANTASGSGAGVTFRSLELKGK